MITDQINWILKTHRAWQMRQALSFCIFSCTVPVPVAHVGNIALKGGGLKDGSLPVWGGLIFLHPLASALQDGVMISFPNVWRKPQD